MNEETCCCGHVLDEHGPVEGGPNALSCTIEECDCVSYEEN